MNCFDAIRSDNSYCHIFGNYDFSLESDMKKGLTYANDICNFLSGNNLELTGGKGESAKFEVENIEVFKVNF